MKKFVVVYLDEDGFECWRQEFSVDEAYKLGYGSIIDEMVAVGVRVRQVGEAICELI